ncbi:hypothetical protein BRADI_2g11012v3 [Brachypodium distachyon]|uniref:Uncharacterized protein n=1 Tax=Brachypodium distachyon TaxID=15368 RepID=A0A0Q3FX44_BRADI|nr:hypothetical protein BRADI_2g11012v3 [Brachypodium distachyon]
MSASKKRNQSVELSSGFSKEKGRRVEDGVNKSHRQRFLSAAATAGPSIPPPSWLRFASPFRFHDFDIRARLLGGDSLIEILVLRSSLPCQARDGGDHEEGEGGARAGLLRRRRPPPPQPPSPSAPSSSSSPPASTEGGGKTTRKGEIAKAIRDRLSSLSPSRTNRFSCWGNTGATRLPIRRSRSGGEQGAPAAVTATMPSRCACVNGDACGCCTRTSKGKAVAVAAAGVRSLVERNDFYCDECNPHK